MTSNKIRRYLAMAIMLRLQIICDCLRIWAFACTLRTLPKLIFSQSPNKIIFQKQRKRQVYLAFLFFLKSVWHNPSYFIWVKKTGGIWTWNLQREILWQYHSLYCLPQLLYVSVCYWYFLQLYSYQICLSFYWSKFMKSHQIHLVVFRFLYYKRKLI